MPALPDGIGMPFLRNVSYDVIETNVEIIAIISKAESADWLARVGEEE